MSLFSNKNKFEIDYMQKYFHPNTINSINKDVPRICTSFVHKSVPGKLKAIAEKKYIWDRKIFNSKNPLKIKFINTVEYTPVLQSLSNKHGIPRTYKPKKNMDGNGNIINWDPLELEFFNDTTGIYQDAISCIKKIIYERFSPIMLAFPIVFVEEGDSHIRVQFDQTLGCNSLVGSGALYEPQTLHTINFGCFDVGIVLHEF